MIRWCHGNGVRGVGGCLTHDDGHLHLERVQVCELRPRAVPRGVDSDGIGGLGGSCQAIAESLRAEARVQHHGGPVRQGFVGGASPMPSAKNAGRH